MSDEINEGTRPTVFLFEDIPRNLHYGVCIFQSANNPSIEASQTVRGKRISKRRMYGDSCFWIV